jgi:hypothetical protein
MARPHGTKNIETPEKMWEYFEAYVKYTKENPILVHDFVGKDGDEIYRKKERPLTLEGFEIWLFRAGIISDFQPYFENRDNRYSDYIYICSRIKKQIRQEQIEGGMAGIYNPSITQRLNALTDKSEMIVKEMPLFPDEL